MKKKSLAVAAIALLLAGTSMAEVVNFNEFTDSFQTTGGFTSGSLSFAPVSGIDVLGVWTTAPDVGAFNGTPYLLDGFGDTFSVARTDAGVFTLDSFDAALGWFQSHEDGATISVTYDLAAGGQSTVVYTLGSGFATFAPGLEITQATFDLGGAGDGYISLDNIAVTSAVPEPGSSSLLLAGLGVIGLVQRRRARARA